jgi:hypothetical protein
MDAPKHPLSYGAFVRRCWWGACKKAWAAFGVSRGWRHIVLAIIGTIAYFAAGGVVLAPTKGLAIALILLLFPVLVLLVALTWNMPKAAYEIYEEAQQQANDAITEGQAEVDQARAVAEALSKEKDDHPKLSMKLITNEVFLSPHSQHWQAVVEVRNTSKKKDIENVELFIESVTPDGAIGPMGLPSAVGLATTFGHQARGYSVKQFKPLHSERFAVVIGQSNMFWPGIRTNFGSCFDIMQHGQITVALKASGSMVEPSIAALVLTGSGTIGTILGITLVTGD